MGNAVKRFLGVDHLNNTPATRLESKARLQVSIRCVNSKSVEYQLIASEDMRESVKQDSRVLFGTLCIDSGL